MKLADALDLANRTCQPGFSPKPLVLVCGFTPLHLAAYIKAHGRLRLPNEGLDVDVGLFGDLSGNLDRAAQKPGEAAVLLEWMDIDPRLGIREAAGWTASVLQDVLLEVGHRLNRLAASIERLAQHRLLAISPPTLPLPPLAHTASSQFSRIELRLNSLMQEFLERVVERPNVRIINGQRLAELSPMGTRFDPKMALATGFPYTLPHASALAQLVIDLLYPASPKKGLITDLDDTLWKGILGEVGADGVQWDLAGHAQPHALYQQLLASLAESGVLIAAASKNEHSRVMEAFSREDILLPSSQIFPIKANWGPKSASIAQILKLWNIGAESVVFIDDSPLELAEVQEHYPQITTLAFPSKDPAGVWKLLQQLRDLFGKPHIAEEDAYRLASLRTASEEQSSADGQTSATFLARLSGTVTISYEKNVEDTRAFELINKTNQFNLNGRRFAHSDWVSHLSQPESFLVTISYQDKFGPLGKIAVVTGLRNEASLDITSWVMSCRAFSRFIENHTLAHLFFHFGADQVKLEFATTDRNQPLQEFLAQMTDHQNATVPLVIARADFESKGLPMPHTVIET